MRNSIVRQLFALFSLVWSVHAVHATQCPYSPYDIVNSKMVPGEPLLIKTSGQEVSAAINAVPWHLWQGNKRIASISPIRLSADSNYFIFNPPPLKLGVNYGLKPESRAMCPRLFGYCKDYLYRKLCRELYRNNCRSYVEPARIFQIIASASELPPPHSGLSGRHPDVAIKESMLGNGWLGFHSSIRFRWISQAAAPEVFLFRLETLTPGHRRPPRIRIIHTAHLFTPQEEFTLSGGDCEGLELQVHYGLTYRLSIYRVTAGKPVAVAGWKFTIPEPAGLVDSQLHQFLDYQKLLADRDENKNFNVVNHRLEQFRHEQAELIKSFDKLMMEQNRFSAEQMQVVAIDPASLPASLTIGELISNDHR